MTRPPTVPGIRTRIHVLYDLLEAGLPFYIDGSEPPGIPPGVEEVYVMGRPCWVLDRDGDHMVVQAKQSFVSP